jgi:hypothetical protein
MRLNAPKNLLIAPIFRPISLILLCVALVAPHRAVSQGLRFRGVEQSIDQRTSYDVLGDRRLHAAEKLDVEFEISFTSSNALGYIMRVKDGSTDRIFNLFFDGQGADLAFSLNREGHRSEISALIDRATMPDNRWARVAISFDLEADKIDMTIAGRHFTAAGVGLTPRFTPVVIFGKSDHIIDVPPFAIRDLSLQIDSRKWLFSLSENSGNAVHDAVGHHVGTVTNPQWLIGESYHWRRIDSLSSPTVAAAVCDPDKQRVYWLNRNQISILDMRTDDCVDHIFASPCPVAMTQGTCFLDPLRQRIYVYEVYRDPALSPAPASASPSAFSASAAAPSVASLDLETFIWRVESHDLLPTQLHHHSAWLDPQRGRYSIFGGFGNMRYSRDIHSFDLATGRWSSVFDSEVLPRYFSSAGHSAAENAVYIFGGMGNESGEQSVGRKYFYDLHRVDLSTGKSRKLWEIPWPERNVVPVRGMILAAGNDPTAAPTPAAPDHFYTLCYPEHLSDSFISLYRFSIADGSHEICGDSIPIHSDKITTNANIYHDTTLDRVYALVQESDDDIASSLKIYSLAFPPITAARLDSWPPRRDSTVARVVMLLLSIVVVVVAAIMMRRRKSACPDDIQRHRANEPNSIALFGDFAVRDRLGRDITYMFSERLRQTFCLILGHSGSGGISSEQLGVLWLDKPEDKVKNLRGVTLNHIRKALGELDGVELRYSGGFYSIVHDDRFWCDALRCMELIREGGVEENRDEFLEIVTRGKFMKFSDGDPLADPFKKEMECLLEPVLSMEIRRSFESGMFRATIALAEAMFHIDPLNSEAQSYLVRSLRRLKLHDDAQIRQRSFALEQKNSL